MTRIRNITKHRAFVRQLFPYDGRVPTAMYIYTHTYPSRRLYTEVSQVVANRVWIASVQEEEPLI